MLPLTEKLSGLGRFVRSLGRLYKVGLPVLDGTVRVPGLRSAVEVRRDQVGVPHLYASSVEDLLFAQGYVHASDRLWQMELHRRVGNGRLAELVGEVAASTDELVRTIGFHRAARRDVAALDGETLQLFSSYVGGINAYLGEHRFAPPLEHLLLGVRPEPWKLEDSFVWAKVISFGLAQNWVSELVVADLVQRLGVERAQELFAEYPEAHPLVVPDSGGAERSAAVIEAIFAELTRSAAELPLPTIAGMSNNWVLAGSRTTTGAPLLANDPHLALQMPGLWYEQHLSAPGFHVAGVGMAGLPAVIIGHNDDIAWGITAALIDTQDLFLERFHPERLHQYAVGSEWRSATVYREEVKVRGVAKPRVVSVVETEHGPLIDNVAPIAARDDGPRFALRWTGLSEVFAARAILKLNRARNWDDFNAALDDWSDPALNFVYADKQHIGYRLAGRIPQRRRGIGAVPVPGWSGEYDWTGYVPAAEMPRSLDPTSGFLASANNQIVGEKFPHFVSVHSMNGARAHRIAELINQKARHDVASLAAMQLDLLSRPAQRWQRLLLDERSAILAHPALALQYRFAETAFDQLATWDGVLGPESVPAAIYELTQYFALRRLFSPHLGKLTEHYLGVGFHPILAPLVLPNFDHAQLIGLDFLVDNRTDWLRDVANQPTTRAAILAGALGDAIAYLRQTLGDDPAAWQWGVVHPAEWKHPLGEKPPLDGLFNRGPFPYGGDVNTVWQASFSPKLPFRAAEGFTASWRQVLDPNDWDRSVGCYPGGVSGHPASPYYADQIEAWLTGQTRPLPFSRAAVERATRHRVTFTP